MPEKEKKIWPEKLKKTTEFFLTKILSSKKMGRMDEGDIFHEDSPPNVILSDEGGFQLLDLIITEVKSHMTC